MKSNSESGLAGLLGNKKRIVLIVLLVLIALSIWWQMSGPSPQYVSQSAAAVRKPVPTSTGAPGKKDPMSSQDPDLQAATLAKGQNMVYESRPNDRNPFDFYTPPPLPPPKPPEKGKGGDGNTDVAPPPAAICGDRICQPGENWQNCPTDCEQPVQPITLKYIGFMMQQDGPVAFLTDGNEVFMGRQNDIIANKYRVLKITDENVELGYLNVNKSSKIPFQGNNKS